MKGNQAAAGGAFFAPSFKQVHGTKKKALVMCISTEDQAEYDRIGYYLSAQKEFKDANIESRKTSAAEFKAGSKKTTFDFVIAPLFNINGNFSEGDFSKFSEAKDFYENYGSAPIFIFVASKMPQEEVWKPLLKDTVKHSDLIVLDDDSQDARHRAIQLAFNRAKAKYDDLREKVVAPQFNKFDTDGSGAIDKEELSNLCKSLGQPLDDSQLDRALKDLDINKDGVIDLEEFCSWWFSGFQSYSTYKRTMLKMKGHYKTAFQALKNGDIESIIGPRDQMKQIKHSLSFSFNKPEKSGSLASFEAHPGGKTSTRIYNELHGRYKDTSTFDMRSYAQANDCSINDAIDVYFQMKIKIKKGVDKKQLGQRMEAAFQDFKDKIPSEDYDQKEFEDDWGFKCKTEGDYLCIGKHLIVPHKVVNEKADLNGDDSKQGVDWYFDAADILEQISEVDQSLKVEMDLGASARDILNSDSTVYDQVCKGFSLTTSLELIRNLKKVIFGLLSDQDEDSQLPKRLKNILMGVSPLVLLKMNANIKLNHDNVQELKECLEQNEKLKPMVGKIEDLGGSNGSFFKSHRAKKFDIDQFNGEDIKNDGLCASVYRQCVLANAALELFDSMAEQADIQISAALPKLGAVLFKIKSDGLGEILKKLQAVITEEQVRSNYEKYCPPKYDEKSPLGKSGIYKRKIKSIYSYGGYSNNYEAITLMSFEGDGFFSSKTDYNSQGSDYYEPYAVKSFGAWNKDGKPLLAPDQKKWQKWQEDHTIFWTERYSSSSNYYYSGKFEDGKIVGSYCGEDESHGTFTIYIEDEEQTKDAEAEAEAENVRENLLLEYFPLHGRAISIRLLLHLCGVDYEDCHLSQEEFENKKADYPYGQVPVLTLKDGTQLAQSDSILRYLGKTYDKDGESLYEGASDPEFSYKIDALMDHREDLISKMKFFYTMKIGTDQYQDQFAKFLTQDFPAWLQKLEETLKENKTTYLLRDSLSLADISAAGLFIAFPYNPKFELCHILQCVVEKYPSVKKYVDTLLKDFKPWMDEYKLPQFSIESKDTKLNYFELLEQIKKKEYGSLNLLKNYRDEEFLKNLIGFTPDKIPHKNEEIPPSKVQINSWDDNGAENLLNNDCMKQWTCDTFKSGQTKLKFTFTEPQQLHFYSFTTAFHDKDNEEAKFCPTSWKVTLIDHKTKEEYSETHSSFAHKHGNKDQKKYLSLTKERFQLLKYVTTSEVVITFLGSSGRSLKQDEDLHAEFNNSQSSATLAQAYQGEPTKATDTEDGEGEFTSEDGVVLQGTFKDGYLHGQGTETNDQGDKYEGNFVNGYREGEGTYTWASDYNKYEGSWKKGKMHGQGKIELYISYSNYTYEGEFAEGVFNGEGELNIPSLSFKGSFKDGKQHGTGMFTCQENNWPYKNMETDGEWKDGKRVHFLTGSREVVDDGRTESLHSNEEETNQQQEIDKSSILEDLVPNKIQINRIQFFGPKGTPVKVDEAKRLKEQKTFEDDGTEDALATYDGEFVQTFTGQKYRDGRGLCKWENGKYYEGLWSNDNLIRGTMHQPEENYSSKIDYEGEFKGYEWSGYGKSNYGSIYYGYSTGYSDKNTFGTTITDTAVVVSEIKDNYFQGKGVYFAKNSEKDLVYIGDFEYDYWRYLGYATSQEDVVVIGNWYNFTMEGPGITAYANGDIIIGQLQYSNQLDEIKHEGYCIKFEAETGVITQVNHNYCGFHGLGIITDKARVSRKAYWQDGEFIQYIEDGDINTLVRCQWQLGTSYDAKYLDPANFNEWFLPEKDYDGECQFDKQVLDLCEKLGIKTSSE